MNNTALIIVDLQNDYFSSFENAKYPLFKTEEALANALKILNKFREKNMKIIHIRHESVGKNALFFQENTQGAQIHSALNPQKNEEQVLKHNINSFKSTDLKQILDTSNIENVIILGAMSHICIDAITRAASDYGYNCSVIHDACASKAVEFNGIKVEATLVHASFMAALEFGYAKVKSTNEILEEI